MKEDWVYRDFEDNKLILALAALTAIAPLDAPSLGSLTGDKTTSSSASLSPTPKSSTSSPSSPGSFVFFPSAQANYEATFDNLSFLTENFALQ